MWEEFKKSQGERKLWTYIEPFAREAGITLELLEKNIINKLVINDLNKGVYSFEKAILTEIDKFHYKSLKMEKRQKINAYL